MSKYCKDCGALNENPLYKYCRKHIWGHQKQKKQYELKRTPVNKVGAIRKKRMQEGGSEPKIFEKVNEVDRNCWICGAPCEHLTFTYPHILNKKDYPAFRLITANIARSCSISHHSELDKKVLAVKRDFEKLKELKDAILKLDRKKVKKLLQCL